MQPRGTPSFPPGYPFLVAALDHLGLAVPWTIVALNLAFLALATASLWIVLRRGLALGEAATGTICALTLLSSAMAKSAVMPLSEIVFYGLVAASLAMLTLSAAKGNVALLLGGIALAAAACSVRTAGVALVPAIVLAFATRRARIISAIGVCTGAAVVVVATPRYLTEFSNGWKPGLMQTAVDEGRSLLTILGAATANVPESKIGSVSAVLVAIGGAALLAVVGAVVIRRRRLGPVDGWVLGSLVVLYLWPSDSVRFLLPLFPFLLGYAVIAAGRWRTAAVAYATVFAVIGLVAIGLSTRLTFSGEAFPERYASGILAPTYRVAWGLAERGDAARVYRPALVVLRRYDPDPPGGR